MYFFNALTAVAKREEEQGGGGTVKRGVWSWLWFLWHARERSSPFPSSRLGLDVSGSHRAEKVGERRDVRSILSNASCLQGDGRHPAPFFTSGLEGRRKEDEKSSSCCKTTGALSAPRGDNGCDLPALRKTLCQKNSMFDPSSGVREQYRDAGGVLQSVQTTAVKCQLDIRIRDF